MQLAPRRDASHSNIMACTVCESTNTKVSFLKNEFRILYCNQCNHLFTDIQFSRERVNVIYSDDYFFGGRTGYDDYTSQEDMLIRRGEYYAGKINKFMAPGKVLDIGSAAGFILKGFENRGWHGTGVEPNASMSEYARTVIGVTSKQIRLNLSNQTRHSI